MGEVVPRLPNDWQLLFAPRQLGVDVERVWEASRFIDEQIFYSVVDLLRALR